MDNLLFVIGALVARLGGSVELDGEEIARMTPRYVDLDYIPSTHKYIIRLREWGEDERKDT